SAVSPPPFLSKTYDMVDDPATDPVVSWSSGNNSFVVWNVPEFARDFLPKYFKHNNFSSFVRQLNTYGFRKVDPDRWEFANEGFLRGHKHLLKNINRRKSSHIQGMQTPGQVQNSSISSFIEVGKFGMDEEVEMLKRDKNVLMQELVRLRQQQQSTENHLQTVGQRVHLMEQRQQQMMSFLAKAMQSPRFVAKLVQQQNGASRQISGGNKKRRIPSQNGEDSVHNSSVVSPDVQIVKYQPLMNEAAKAMLRQVLNRGSPNRVESEFSNDTGFLIGNTSPPHGITDTGSSSDKMSEVTLSEELHTSAALIETQPSSEFVQLEFDHAFSKSMAGLQDLTPGQGVSLLRNPDVPDSSFKQVDSNYGDTISSFGDAPVPIESDEVYADEDVGSIDDIHKLPGINDVFWEQFLSESSLAGDADYINPVNLAQNDVIDPDNEQELEWGKLKNLSNLTEQMGLLASVSKSG
ncbi:hypothetical protein M569_05693, partial [Genlisea aurea]